jgi:ectoine hydroxylase-related dioxygenase (phytanoyl-CoA dioxygenase family)
VIWSELGFVQTTIPETTCRNLLSRVNEEFALDFDSDRVPEYEHITYFPKLAASAEMRAYASELGRLMGVDENLSCESAQIALRFPGNRKSIIDWHVDGVLELGDETGRKCGAILGIYLSDVLTAEDGPIHVVSGSHLEVAAFAKAHGWHVMRRGNLPTFPPGHFGPILGKAGTAILFHPHLVHRVLPNHGPHIRYAIYFRYYERERR